MGWGVNQKAAEKRDREANKKKEEQRQREQKKETQKWKDQHTEKKIQSAQLKEEKRMQELARKRELKELAEREQQEMEKQTKKNKGEFQEKKLTQAELMEREQKRLLEQLERDRENDGLVKPDYPAENVNKNLEGYEVANSVEGVLNALDDGEQRHPQRRFKAAFQAYCQKRDGSLKIDYPKLKRSQRLQMMRKQFEKHPDNPYNKKNIVAYNHNPRKQEQQKEE